MDHRIVGIDGESLIDAGYGFLQPSASEEFLRFSHFAL
jgi:hypothetical protein